MNELRIIKRPETEILESTRSPAEHNLGDLTGLISHGASPQATLGLVAGSRVLALMRGREFVLPQDVLEERAS